MKPNIVLAAMGEMPEDETDNEVIVVVVNIRKVFWCYRRARTQMQLRTRIIHARV